jgi:hypothetical protein
LLVKKAYDFKPEKAVWVARLSRHLAAHRQPKFMKKFMEQKLTETF